MFRFPFLFIFFLFNLFLCPAQNNKPGTGAQHERSISFSGYQWTVRDIAGKQGPGPNFFSDSSVQVDDKGWLHLWIKKDDITGQWRCAEITSDARFKYGTYRFIVEGAIDHFDKNIVLGLFNYSGNDGLDEMDIEIARWGNHSFPNLNYTIWPAKKEFKNSATTKEFSLKSELSTHYFRWSADTVICASFDSISTDLKNQVFSSTFASPATSISQLAMPVHVNLWLFDGNPPADQKPVEVVIRSFRYTP
ncbi:MAG: glycoside hydrolase family 16 protein [Ginsengibacter sp.]